MRNSTQTAIFGFKILFDIHMLLKLLVSAVCVGLLAYAVTSPSLPSMTGEPGLISGLAFRDLTVSSEQRPQSPSGRSRTSTRST
jgi:hypothetical protein